MNQSSLLLGIKRINQKLYKTASEKEKLKEYTGQLQTLLDEKHNLRTAFANQRQIFQANLLKENPALKLLVSELTIENKKKTVFIKKTKEQIKSVFENKISKPDKLLTKLKNKDQVNEHKLLKVAKAQELEDNHRESLEFALKRLQNDSQLTKTKVEKILYYLSFQNKNRQKIQRTQNVSHFEHVA